MIIDDKREPDRYGLPWSEASSRFGEVFEMVGPGSPAAGAIVMVCIVGNGSVKAVSLATGNRMCDTPEEHDHYTYHPVTARVVIGEEE